MRLLVKSGNTSACEAVALNVNLLQAEKKMEQKRRGNKDTQTSDAKFDEQFKLGHQMAAKVGSASPIDTAGQMGQHQP